MPETIPLFIILHSEFSLYNHSPPPSHPLVPPSHCPCPPLSSHLWCPIQHLTPHPSLGPTVMETRVPRPVGQQFSLAPFLKATELVSAAEESYGTVL